MTRRIIAIAFIFVCASVGWAILGGTLFSRTYSSDSLAENRVASTWGTQQTQSSPTASFTRIEPKQEEITENGKKVVKTVQQQVPIPLSLESSAIDVTLDLEHRQKGLLWFSTYKVAFAGVYGFRNTSDKEETVNFTLKFPTSQAMYDDLTFMVDNNSVSVVNHENASTRKRENPARKDSPADGWLSVSGVERVALQFWRPGCYAGSRLQTQDENKLQRH